MADINFYRVLQHDKADQIRIGSAFPSNNLDKTVGNLIEQYDKDLEWCGGITEGFKKYYRRIAIVDADTLKVVRLVYPKTI